MAETLQYTLSVRISYQYVGWAIPILNVHYFAKMQKMQEQVGHLRGFAAAVLH